MLRFMAGITFMYLLIEFDFKWSDVNISLAFWSKFENLLSCRPTLFDYLEIHLSCKQSESPLHFLGLESKHRLSV